MPTFKYGNEEIEYSIRYSNRAKRMSVRMNLESIEGVIPANSTYTEQDLAKFINQKAEVIFDKWCKLKVKHSIQSKKRQQEPKAIDPDTGRITQIYYKGELIPVYIQPKKMSFANMTFHIELVEISESRCKVTLPAGHSPAYNNRLLFHAIKTFLSESTYDEAIEIAAKYSKKYNLQYTYIKIRDTKSRWGSCSSAGAINLSARLIMCPPKVLEYIVVHELAHLKHQDHSKSFWDFVEKMMPDYHEHKLWIKENGTMIMSII